MSFLSWPLCSSILASIVLLVQPPLGICLYLFPFCWISAPFLFLFTLKAPSLSLFLVVSVLCWECHLSPFPLAFMLFYSVFSSILDNWIFHASSPPLQLCPYFYQWFITPFFYLSTFSFRVQFEEKWGEFHPSFVSTYFKLQKVHCEEGRGLCDCVCRVEVRQDTVQVEAGVLYFLSCDFQLCPMKGSVTFLNTEQNAWKVEELD